MSKQFIARIAVVRLRSVAGQRISHHTYERIQAWLKQWTPEGNFKGVIAESRTACADILRHEDVVPHWLKAAGVKASDFEFELNGTEVEDGRFWSSFQMRWCATHTFADLPNVEEQKA
jgi:hypothetical protein